MISCIYTITNKVNGKIYVGKTNHFFKRKSQHKCALREKIHNNRHLQRAWNTYGEDSFLFEILEEYPKEYLYAMEHYWCIMLDCFNYDKGYNEKPTHPLNKGGNSIASREKVRIANTGKKASQEAKEKMSLAKLGIKMSDSTKLKMSIAGKNKHYSKETIKKFSTYRYNHPLTPFLGKKIPKEIIDKRANTRKIPIVQYTLNMKFVREWKSGLDVQNILEINRKNISSCLTGHRHSTGGFIWKYANKS